MHLDTEDNDRENIQEDFDEAPNLDRQNDLIVQSRKSNCHNSDQITTLSPKQYQVFGELSGSKNLKLNKKQMSQQSLVSSVVFNINQQYQQQPTNNFQSNTNPVKNNQHRLIENVENNNSTRNLKECIFNSQNSSGSQVETQRQTVNKNLKQSIQQYTFNTNNNNNNQQFQFQQSQTSQLKDKQQVQGNQLIRNNIELQQKLSQNQSQSQNESRNENYQQQQNYEKQQQTYQIQNQNQCQNRNKKELQITSSPENFKQKKGQIQQNINGILGQGQTPVMPQSLEKHQQFNDYNGVNNKMKEFNQVNKKPSSQIQFQKVQHMNQGVNEDVFLTVQTQQSDVFQSKQFTKLLNMENNNNKFSNFNNQNKNNINVQEEYNQDEQDDMQKNQLSNYRQGNTFRENTQNKNQVGQNQNQSYNQNCNNVKSYLLSQQMQQLPSSQIQTKREHTKKHQNSLANLKSVKENSNSMISNQNMSENQNIQQKYDNTNNKFNNIQGNQSYNQNQHRSKQKRSTVFGDNLFEAFMVYGPNKSSLNKNQQKGVNKKLFHLSPKLLHQHLENPDFYSYAKEDIVRHFAFPQGVETEEFSLTDESDKKISQSNLSKSFWSTQKVYCFMTAYPFVQFFLDIIVNMLNNIKEKKVDYFSKLDDLKNKQSNNIIKKLEQDFFQSFLKNECSDLLRQLRKIQKPQINYKLQFTHQNFTSICQIPNKERAQHIEAEWGNCLVLSNIEEEVFSLLYLYILCENQVVFISQNEALLSSTLLLFHSLLKPFKWPHPVIFNLPHEFMHLLDSPIPILLGLNKNIDQVYEEQLSEKHPNCVFILLDEFQKTQENYQNGKDQQKQDNQGSYLDECIINVDKFIHFKESQTFKQLYNTVCPLFQDLFKSDSEQENCHFINETVQSTAQSNYNQDNIGYNSSRLKGIMQQTANNFQNMFNNGKQKSNSLYNGQNNCSTNSKIVNSVIQNQGNGNSFVQTSQATHKFSQVNMLQQNLQQQQNSVINHIQRKQIITSPNTYQKDKAIKILIAVSDFVRKEFLDYLPVDPCYLPNDQKVLDLVFILDGMIKSKGYDDPFMKQFSQTQLLTYYLETHFDRLKQRKCNHINTQQQNL
ncbi:hypothetical protein PPERSA_06207 [Pseudocohnilembus persalinus]|uniref:cDENN domain-containing protein n=1 Tax=Pseudocohnilembus persalinus TaxID=266149 RepID=A0A0V0R0Z8_PSEPJ|nr:hypothetical protein PPERSA_06207 [Pseudocohnilembus persalinus]|eukprot:KRX08029.1 hypothetical protein PPERSA_06207 [Pseudocohnilembus persalinus]